MSDWLTVDELAALLKIGKSTVQKKVAARVWPHHNLGGVRFSPEDVAAIDAATAVPAANGVRAAVVPIRTRSRRSA
jgi:excisionase family DNA binding protein